MILTTMTQQFGFIVAKYGWIVMVLIVIIVIWNKLRDKKPEEKETFKIQNPPSMEVVFDETKE